jgi:hypothetical protein
MLTAELPDYDDEAQEAIEGGETETAKRSSKG